MTEFSSSTLRTVAVVDLTDVIEVTCSTILAGRRVVAGTVRGINERRGRRKDSHDHGDEDNEEEFEGTGGRHLGVIVIVVVDDDDVLVLDVLKSGLVVLLLLLLLLENKLW